MYFFCLIVFPLLGIYVDILKDVENDEEEKEYEKSLCVSLLICHWSIFPAISIQNFSGKILSLLTELRILICNKTIEYNMKEVGTHVNYVTLKVWLQKCNFGSTEYFHDTWDNWALNQKLCCPSESLFWRYFFSFASYFKSVLTMRNEMIYRGSPTWVYDVLMKPI